VVSELYANSHTMKKCKCNNFSHSWYHFMLYCHITVLRIQVFPYVNFTDPSISCLVFYVEGKSNL